MNPSNEGLYFALKQAWSDKCVVFDEMDARHHGGEIHDFAYYGPLLSMIDIPPYPKVEGAAFGGFGDCEEEEAEALRKEPYTHTAPHSYQNLYQWRLLYDADLTYDSFPLMPGAGEPETGIPTEEETTVEDDPAEDEAMEEY